MLDQKTMFEDFTHSDKGNQTIKTTTNKVDLTNSPYYDKETNEINKNQIEKNIAHIEASTVSSYKKAIRYNNDNPNEGIDWKKYKKPKDINKNGEIEIDKNQSYSFKRLSEGEEKSWNDVVTRLIKELLRRGAKTPVKDLEWLLYNYYALPNSPALLTSGKSHFYASACSSYPLQDSMDEGVFSILNTLKISSMATKAGIGTGFNFSKLRSKKETVHGKTGVTGGPVSFLRAINGFVGEITQATRKSASMGLLNMRHPDVEDFIYAKKHDGEIQGFNISVVIDDKFMNAVKNDEDYELPYIHNEGSETVKAKDLYKNMCARIWDNGEPGVMFEDIIKRDYFEDDMEILVNPCSEALLTHGDDWLELCVLASINIPKYEALKTPERKRVVSIIVSMLNDIIDTQDYVTELQSKGMKEKNRKIGIGVTGLATQLAKEGIKYSSDEAAEYTKKMFKEIGDFALEASSALGTIYATIDGKEQELGRYNGSLLSVAPTSTLSNIFEDINEEGCSYGIEPYFAIKPIKIHNSYGDFEKKEKIIDYLNGEISHIETANDLHWKDHLKTVEAYYKSNPKGILQGCSKTVNFKNNIKVEDVEDAVMYCWEHDIKAVSFYRDGSRQNQVITTEDSYAGASSGVVNEAPKRPAELEADVFHVKSENQNWLVLVGLREGRPYEVFAGLEEKINLPRKIKKVKIIKENKKYNLVIGETEDERLVIRDIPAMFENKEFATITRFVSMSLRHNVPFHFIVEQLLRDGNFDAFNKALSRVLKKYVKENQTSGESCPNCGAKLRYVQGCLSCDCGFTKCG